ncbi:hypothetical protein Tdes44962_MAKER03247 [Teratosphaeria destructans]|uniref:Uncharacterized protein n=1 Tax=Teratosphaeria destructans TaxID=418781 RepID=A0A9W7SQG1_9PEZI|nr:hypothetical protein Tdes44962_MAKER03247 [Teratosphaeria destructans]
MAQSRPANNFPELIKQFGDLQRKYKPVLKSTIEQREAENAEQVKLFEKINARVEKLHRDAEESAGVAPVAALKNMGVEVEDAAAKKAVQSIEKVDTPGYAMMGVEMTGFGTGGK